MLNAALKRSLQWTLQWAIPSLLLLAIAIATPALSDHQSSKGVLHSKSHYSVERTVERAKRILEHHGFRVFGVIDHQANAQQRDLSLPPTRLLVFGQIESGTALMNKNRLIGIDLPLKLLVWQDDKRMVWISYNEPEFLQKRHGLSAHYKIFQKLQSILQDISAEAAE